MLPHADEQSGWSRKRTGGGITQLKTEHVKTEVKSYQIGGKIGFLPRRNLLTPSYTSFTTIMFYTRVPCLF